MSEARSRWEKLNSIRKEMFYKILPLALRENNIGMRIHVMREGNPDPLKINLGGESRYYIFTDKGGDRIERAVLGGYGDEHNNVIKTRAKMKLFLLNIILPKIIVHLLT